MNHTPTTGTLRSTDVVVVCNTDVRPVVFLSSQGRGVVGVSDVMYPAPVWTRHRREGSRSPLTFTPAKNDQYHHSLSLPPLVTRPRRRSCRGEESMSA